MGAPAPRKTPAQVAQERARAAAAAAKFAAAKAAAAKAKNDPPPTTPPPTGGTPPPYTPPPDYGFKPPPKDTASTMATVAWYNSKTGETYIASNGGYTPPNSDWAVGEMGRDGKVTPRNPPETPPPSVAPPVEVVAPPYVPYIPPNGRTLPPYAPYTPSPFYPPNTPPPTGGTAPPYTPAPPSGSIVYPTPDPDGNTYGGPTSDDGKWLYSGGKWWENKKFSLDPIEGGRYATRPPVADPRDSRGGGRQTAPEGRPGEGFNPSPGFARTMLDAGKAMSNYPVMAPFGMPAKVAGSLATKYGSYLSTVAERNAAAKNAAANPNSGGMLGNQSSRVRSQLRSNEGYGDGPGDDRFGGVIGVSGVTAGVGEAGRGMPNTGGGVMGAGTSGAGAAPSGGGAPPSGERGGGGQSGRGEATGGREGEGGSRDASGGGDRGTRGGFAHGGIAALHQRVSKMGRSPKKPK